MFGSLTWQERNLLEQKLAEVRATAAEARRSRLCQADRKQRERGYWCLCIRMPRLLVGGKNG